MKKRKFPAWRVTVLVLCLLSVGCGSPPTDTTLIYHGLRKESLGLWRMLPDGSGVTQLTSSGWYGEYSPDNSKIAYSEPYDNGIWVVNADGTHPVQLTTFGSAPSWSPDGSQLVFHAGGQKGADHFLWIMNANGTDTRQLSTVTGSFAHWSPLKDKILFHGEVNNGIWVIDPDGSNETLLHKMGGYPAWSPDGQEIAYVDLVDWCIWVMDAAGQNKRKLTNHRGNLPAWSADGSKIVYEGLEEEESGIWVINSDGSGDHRINKEGRHPVWSN